MSLLQRLLLVIISCLWSSMVFAEIHVDVLISGIENRLEENVRLFLSIEQQKDHALMSEGRLRRLHKKANQEITNALQPFGYYRPVIASSLSSLDEGHWQATYRIDTGPEIRIARFDLSIRGEMAADPAFLNLRDNLPLKQGDVFEHRPYEQLKTSLLKLASERGYVDARFTAHKVEVDLDAYEARVQLSYDSGPRYAFGQVNVSQQVLKPALMDRFVSIEVGTPYDLNELISLQQALNDSDYFQSVEVSPGQPQSQTHQIPVDINVVPRKKHRYSFGLGYGTDTGARTSFSWEMPLINNRGHRVRSELDVSEIGYSASVHYAIPVLNPRTDRLIYSAGQVNEKTDTSESTVQTIGVSLNKSRGEWRESISLEYQEEDFSVADVSEVSRLLIPGISWSRTWGRGLIYTLDGVRFDLGLQGASAQLASDIDFFQMQGGIKAIHALGEKNRLIARGRLGSTWTEAFDSLPSSVRYFAGGAQSVRGYAYQSLGPVDDSGDIEGGKHLMVGSIEFEHSFSERWGMAVFYDGGNAINSLGDDLERGAGFGWRWKSPVGPVRIDFASAISQPSDPWRIHINIGPDL